MAVAVGPGAGVKRARCDYKDMEGQWVRGGGGGDRKAVLGHVHRCGNGVWGIM